MNAIEINNISKYYNDNKVLDSISLAIKEGQIFSLLGANGAGKTTLFKILLSIVNPSSGSAKIFDQNIKKPKSRKQVGYLAENHNFFNYLTGKEVLYYYGKMSGVKKSKLSDKIAYLLKLVELENKGNTIIKQYSKGMLQRLGLAQALIHDPKLLFLDEPTDGIDPVGRKRIRDLLLKMKDEGKTIFINSHLLSEVEKISDQIAILKNGNVIKQGKLADFLENKNIFFITIVDFENRKEEVTKIFQAENIAFKVQENSFEINAKDEAMLNRAIDLLRRQQIAILEINRKKEDLEDYFIKIITRS